MLPLPRGELPKKVEIKFDIFTGCGMLLMSDRNGQRVRAVAADSHTIPNDTANVGGLTEI